MAVDGVGFVGMRSARFAETADLFRDVIGARVSRRTADMVGFELSDGSILELYSPADDFHSFFTTGPVVGFRVDDFDATRARMLAAGVDFIGQPQHRDGTFWQHFHCPDRTIAEIIGTGSPWPNARGR